MAMCHGEGDSGGCLVGEMDVAPLNRPDRIGVTHEGTDQLGCSSAPASNGHPFREAARSPPWSRGTMSAGPGVTGELGDVVETGEDTGGTTMTSCRTLPPLIHSLRDNIPS